MNKDQENKFWELLDALYERTKYGASYYAEVTAKGEQLLEIFKDAVKDKEAETETLKRTLKKKEDYISELQENIYFMENTIRNLQNDKEKLANRTHLDEIRGIVFA